jgi:pyruvate ferredoxin oxidoreductase alpha subunit
MEHKFQQASAMKNAKKIILDVAKEFAALSGREYGLFEEYCMEDAERALILIGSSAGTAKHAVDILRKKGEKVGLIKLRVFRPFPMKELARALSSVKVAAVMDKAESFSAAGGPLFSETRSACYGMAGAPLMINYIYGLGGRDVRVDDITLVFEKLSEIMNAGNAGEVYRYLALKG